MQEKQKSTKAKSNIFSFNERESTSWTRANCPNKIKKEYNERKKDPKLKIQRERERETNPKLSLHGGRSFSLTNGRINGLLLFGHVLGLNQLGLLHLALSSGWALVWLASLPLAISTPLPWSPALLGSLVASRRGRTAWEGGGCLRDFSEVLGVEDVLSFPLL